MPVGRDDDVLARLHLARGNRRRDRGACNGKGLGETGLDRRAATADGRRGRPAVARLRIDLGQCSPARAGQAVAARLAGGPAQVEIKPLLAATGLQVQAFRAEGMARATQRVVEHRDDTVRRLRRQLEGGVAGAVVARVANVVSDLVAQALHAALEHVRAGADHAQIDHRPVEGPGHGATVDRAT